MPIVVVLPDPLTPTNSTTRGRGPSEKSTICSRGARTDSISAARASLISFSVISLSKRSFDRFLVTRWATAAPRSDVISRSSRSSSVSSSSLRLLNAARPVPSREDERARPDPSLATKPGSFASASSAARAAASRSSRSRAASRRSSSSFSSPAALARAASRSSRARRAASASASSRRASDSSARESASARAVSARRASSSRRRASASASAASRT